MIFTDEIIIKPIKAQDTLAIRHKVMWPNKSIAYVKLPEDENGEHFGLFLQDKLVSVISLFINKNEAQFRKFATLQEFQGMGLGSVLLKKLLAIVEERGLKKLWCNARVEKIGFYERFNFQSTGKKFVKGGIDFVIVEKVF